MHLVDSSVWLALTLSGHVHHDAARVWLDSISESASVHFCRSTQQSYLRLLTTAKVVSRFGDPPFTNRQAWSFYEAFFTDDRIVFRGREPSGLEKRWRQFAARESASPKLWMDAYLAAFALAGGYQLVTIDAAFAQFEGLDFMVLGFS